MPIIDDHRTDWDALRNGDKQALFSLYNDLYFHLIRFGLKLNPDDELAKDCVNQIFLNIWDRRDRLPEVANVRSYLLTTLRNVILDEIARRNRMNSAIQKKILEEDIDELSYEEIIIRMQHDEELKKKLQNALKQLTPKQIELVQLRFFEGLPYEEIARLKSQTVKTAYNTIYDAVKTLRRLLK